MSKRAGQKQVSKSAGNGPSHTSSHAPLRAALLATVALGAISLAAGPAFAAAPCAPVAAGLPQTGGAGGDSNTGGAGGAGGLYGLQGGAGTTNNGGGGSGADCGLGGQAIGLGGTGGAGGTSGFTGGAFVAGTAYIGNGGGNGGSALDGGGGGGGGAGGFGAILTGSGPFASTANIVAGNGGNGGYGGYGEGNGGNGGDGGIGVYVGGNAASFTTSGIVRGGTGGYGGYAYYGAGGKGGNGGAGVFIANGVNLVNSGTIAGGGGGRGYSSRYGQESLGGTAGAGVYLAQSGTVTSTAGSISGGYGAAGRDGAAGIVFAAGGTLNNSGGSQVYGGRGGSSRNGFSDAGAGGAGVVFGASGTVNNSDGIIRGGNARYGATASAAQNAGGAGISMLFGGTINNSVTGAAFMTTIPAGTILGGDGGPGGYNKRMFFEGPLADIAGPTPVQSGNGGAGISGANLTVNNNAGANITGGKGGSFSTSSYYSYSGTIGGAGGAGISASFGTINNAGTIAGGAGGVSKPATTCGSTVTVTLVTPIGPGGAGITGSNLNVVNSGTISGGLNSVLTGTGCATTVTAGIVRANAIEFTGGVNSLTIQAGSNIIGNVVALKGGNDILAIGGTVNSTFDVTQVAAPGATDKQYQNFARFQKTGTSKWSLTGIATAGTAWTIVGGTLSITDVASLGTGPLTIKPGATFAFGANQINLTNNVIFASAGDPVFDTGAFNSTISGVISGAGDLSKIGSGILTLTAANTYTGVTTVQEGTLLVTGSIAASIATVNSGATIGGAGTLGGLVALSGGTVSPGVAAPFSTLNVAGNVNFQAGSIYIVTISAAGQTDRILATGAATLAGGTVNVTAGTGVYTSNMSYTILTAAGGVTGKFGGLVTTSNLAFLTPSLAYVGNNVNLVFASNAAPLFASVALTPNQLAGASGLQSLGAGNALFNAVQSQTVAGAQRAFDLTSGEIHASAVSAAFEDSRFVREAVLDRLWNASLGNTAPGGAAGAARDAPYALWGQGFGDWGKNSGNGNAATLDRSIGGLMFGADAALGSAFRLGAAGGYISDEIKVTNRASSGNITSVFGSLYGSAAFGAFNLRGGASYAGNHNSLRRSINLGNFTDATRATYDGSTFQGFGEAGYRMSFGSATLEPFVGAAVIHVEQNGFRETGGLAALTSGGRSYDMQTTTLGLRAEIAPLGANTPLMLRGLLGWRHAYSTTYPKAVLSFASGSIPFSVAGAPIARDAALVEAVLDYRATQALTIGVAYSGQIAAKAQDHAVKGNFSFKF